MKESREADTIPRSLILKKLNDGFVMPKGKLFMKTRFKTSKNLRICMTLTEVVSFVQNRELIIIRLQLVPFWKLMANVLMMRMTCWIYGRNTMKIYIHHLIFRHTMMNLKLLSKKVYKHIVLTVLNVKTTPLDNPFEFVEVQSVIQKLPNGKVGGVDDLTYEHLKYGGNCLTKFLVNIFNEIRVEECVPNKWTMGSIISILKSGKRNKLNKGNYRGITLLNVLGKVFERLFLDRWTPHFNSLGIPNQFQFAYQNEKSCVLSSFALQESIFYNLERGSKVHCCFLDSSKAFDTVWLDGLFYKLYNNGMKGKFWRILRDWYNRMACCVSVNGVNTYFF